MKLNEDLNLRMHPDTKKEDVDKITEIVREVKKMHNIRLAEIIS